ncbi:secretin N-terminal domain-containing protein [Chitinibacter bivalviorum]|uniref:Secretin N-terminal domain-containing protein n=1 Tax=Chitinibacter bivalviorum TaxID=2739434 RepID=A0A7H9BKF5_9NEIS|nr:secretin N-terminal domain-containing protein [Chitinibacter bivalviorum]QLG88806.1 secretin N-terminal domain-containing protein [Chitinibacter bivalviorum]
MKPLILPLLIASTLTACATNNGLPPREGRHVQAAPEADVNIPKPVTQIPYLPKPSQSAKLETYSVVVSQLPVNELLFALARDAKINVDVHPSVSGSVTLNAINQTLPQILDRIAKQVDIRWTLEQGVLTIAPDTPYLKTYRVDYFNLSRNMKSSVNILNSVASSDTQGGGTGGNNNTSSTSIDSENPNQFWKRLEANLKEILGVKDNPTTAAATAALAPPVTANVGKQVSQTVNNANTDAKTALALAEGLAKIEKTVAQTEKLKQESSAAAAPIAAVVEPNLVVMNPESGTISIRASHKDQQKVAEFLAMVQSSAQRQVMIEATIVEVALSDQYQAGVDWSKIASGNGWSVGQSLIGSNLAAAPVSVLSYKGTNLVATLKLLEQFGRARVLSSPKVIALNNQTAVMKVVEEQVYFTLTVTEGTNTPSGITGATYESTLHTVPVGLVMQVTPQISESGLISMNVRPTITNISGYVQDPAVALMSRTESNPVQSLIPILQVREFDSTLKIASGQSAVLGGLIQDKQTNSRQGVPGLSRIPWVGDAFSYRDDTVRKIELVVFLRPIVVHEDGLNGAQSGLKSLLPGEDFFNPPSDQAISAFQSGVIPLPKEAGK